MISSTLRDLPEHRIKVADACLRLSVKPIMMEHLASQDLSASNVSVGMVRDASVYLGILAFSYGSCPENDNRSYTEIELEEAERLGLKVLVFFADENTPWPPIQVDTGENARKLRRLKRVAAKNRITATFKSPEDLRGLVIHALIEFIKTRQESEDIEPRFHPVNFIPPAPQAYVAHPYVLLQTRDVIGRLSELDLLTDWITSNRHIPKTTRILTVEAFGGMGKSALTWKWFEHIASKNVANLAGRMWWSFYESDASWENFVIRGLAYSTGSSEQEIGKLSPVQREDAFFMRLNEAPFLLVLDGFERILVAYARMDAARLSDEEVDVLTAHIGFGPFDEGIKNSTTIRQESHRLRQCSDVRVGAFLRRLTTLENSRILVSSRLYPAELETATARATPESKILWDPGMRGCFRMRLGGLNDEDALALWKSFTGGNRTASTDQLLALFHAFDNYPLLLRALAGEVAQYRPAPGDLATWLEDHPDFNPAKLPLRNRRAHVLEFALRGLGNSQIHVLRMVAAFRMPVSWDTLRALLVSRRWLRSKVFSEDSQLGEVLIELEDRGLVGWDRGSNRYDLHPVVRAVVWHGIGGWKRRAIHASLRKYFHGISDAKLQQDGYVSIHLYGSLIGLRRFEDAIRVYSDRIAPAPWQLIKPQTRIELLEQLVPSCSKGVSKLRDKHIETYAATELADAYSKNGQPLRAISLLEQTIRGRGARHYGFADIELAKALLQTGAICQAVQQSHSLYHQMTRSCENRGDGRHDKMRRWQYAIVRAVMGEIAEASTLLEHDVSYCSSQRKLRDRDRDAFLDHAAASEAMAYLKFTHAASLINPDNLSNNVAWKLMERSTTSEPELILVARLRGLACISAGLLDEAIDSLSEAVRRSREISLVEEELPALVALARIHLSLAEREPRAAARRKRHGIARHFLSQVWAPAKRGPYPLWHSEASSVLAQLERDSKQFALAIEAADSAYRLAWCDGLPYSYQYALSTARRHLLELGAPAPRCPPFDSSRFPPLRDLGTEPSHSI